MQSISDTIKRLRKLRSAHSSAPMFEDRLTDLGPFGSNPSRS